MKFNSLSDKKLFLIDIDEVDLTYKINNDWMPTVDMIELFVKKRRSEIKGIKNFRKSQASKRAWRHNRYKMMKGVKKFHKSTDGKKFHRALGRFLATRDARKITTSRNEDYLYSDIAPILKGLSSAQTHALIEFDYYATAEDQVDYEEFIECLYDITQSIEKS